MARILNEEEAIAKIRDQLASFERQVGKKITGYYQHRLYSGVRPCDGTWIYFYCCPDCGWIKSHREDAAVTRGWVRCEPGNSLEVY